MNDCQEYRVGRFTLQPFRQLLDGGTPVLIGRKPLELLSVLAKAEGALVTKDELMAAIWPNAIVEENALQVHAGVLRKLLGTESELLSTVHGFGYRLVATKAEPAGGLAAVKPRYRVLTPVLIAAAAIVVAGWAAPLFWTRPALVPAQSVVARFAVLPFDTLSDGPQARHFADSLTDEIVTELNSNRIQVVSRDDAATLRGSDRNRKIAELGVALLLGGMVQDDGNTVKVRVHLDDPARHATLWSESVDGPAADSDQLQARIASTIVAVLACSNRALVPVHGLTDPDLLTRYLHACDLMVNPGSSAYEVLASLREVAAKAPGFTPAHSDLAKFDTYYSPNLPPDQAAPLRQEGEAEAHKALALDPKSPDAYLTLAVLLPPTDWAGRERLLRQGVAGDPDWPITNGVLGLMLADTGRLQDAAGFMQKAAAANLPTDWRPQNAVLQCGSGQFEPAMSYLSAELKRNPIANYAWYSLRKCLKFAGRWADLRGQTSYVQEANRKDPSSTMYDIYLVAEESGKPADVARARNAALAVLPGDWPVTIANAIEALSVLGFADDAFAVAQRFAPRREEDSAFLFSPLTAPLRRDPRFMQLAARLGLVDYWRGSGHWPDFCSEPGLPYDCRDAAAKAPILLSPSRPIIGPVLETEKIHQASDANLAIPIAGPKR